MLLALSGITGVGKSFYAEEIAKKLDFKKVHTIRTRTMRIGEQNGKTGLFMTHEELQKLKDDGGVFDANENSSTRTNMPCRIIMVHRILNLTMSDQVSVWKFQPNQNIILFAIN